MCCRMEIVGQSDGPKNIMALNRRLGGCIKVPFSIYQKHSLIAPGLLATLKLSDLKEVSQECLIVRPHRGEDGVFYHSHEILKVVELNVIIKESPIGKTGEEIACSRPHTAKFAILDELANVSGALGNYICLGHEFIEKHFHPRPQRVPVKAREPGKLRATLLGYEYKFMAKSTDFCHKPKLQAVH